RRARLGRGRRRRGGGRHPHRPAARHARPAPRRRGDRRRLDLGGGTRGDAAQDAPAPRRVARAVMGQPDAHAARVTPELPAPNRSALFPALFTDELVRAGVQHACVTPGSRSTPLVLALASHPALRVWPHLDERCAAFFALGLAKATRLPVALACTSGTAAANFLPAVVEAFHTRAPLIVLTADRPPELPDCAAQPIGAPRLLGATAAGSGGGGAPGARPEARGGARRLACRAGAAATGPPAGPVHLTLPFREPLTPEVANLPAPLAPDLASHGRFHGPWTWVPAAHPELDAAAAAEVTLMLAEARRPLVV